MKKITCLFGILFYFSVIFPPVPLIHPVNCKIEGRGDRNSSGKLYVETAESIPPLELVDTTGAGDAFIGAVIYGKCNSFALSFPYGLLKVCDIKMCNLHRNFYMSYV